MGDEDDEMKKFIETEMGKIKGKDLEVEKESEGSKYLSPEDAALQALPEHLKKSTFKKDQQMLSAQMLAGIPEVDLGIEVKIQNIERTERAKRDLLAKGEINTGGLAMARFVFLFWTALKLVSLYNHKIETKMSRNAN